MPNQRVAAHHADITVPMMRGVPESEMRLVIKGGDKIPAVMEIDMRSGIRRYALRVDSEGMMVPDVKKRGARRGQWTCPFQKKKIGGVGRVAEEWMLGARFGTVLNNCFRTILLYPVLGEGRTEKSLCQCALHL